MSDLYAVDSKELKFSWMFFFVHFFATYMLASLAVASNGYIDIVKPIVDIASSIFPSINGMGALSPDAPWGSVYLGESKGSASHLISKLTQHATSPKEIRI